MHKNPYLSNPLRSRAPVACYPFIIIIINIGSLDAMNNLDSAGRVRWLRILFHFPKFNYNGAQNLCVAIITTAADYKPQRRGTHLSHNTIFTFVSQNITVLSGQRYNIPLRHDDATRSYKYIKHTYIRI